MLIQQQQRSDDRPDHFVMLDWSDERVSKIPDFLFARCVVADAEHASLQPIRLGPALDGAPPSQDQLLQVIDYDVQIGWQPAKLSSRWFYPCVDRQKENQCNQINNAAPGACPSPR